MSFLTWNSHQVRSEYQIYPYIIHHWPTYPSFLHSKERPFCAFDRLDFFLLILHFLCINLDDNRVRPPIRISLPYQIRIKWGSSISKSILENLTSILSKWHRDSPMGVGISRKSMVGFERSTYHYVDFVFTLTNQLNDILQKTIWLQMIHL